MWKERITPPVRSLAGAMALLGVLLLAVAHFGAGPADAQSATTTSGNPVRYSLVPVDQIVPKEATDSVEEVIAFGKNNVYMVTTKKALIVFRVTVQAGTVRNLRIGEVPLTADGYKEIVVLDDQASFLVRNSKGVAVWSVTQSEIVPARQR